MLTEELEQSPLFQLLSHQQIILTYAHAKLEILNYWRDGYDSNKPVLMNNRYLIFTSHVYYRSLILDFCALYGSRGGDKRSFHKIKNHYNILNAETKAWLDTLLAKYNNKISPILDLTTLRDKHIAHYDLHEIQTLSFNHDHIELMNKLYKLGETIVKRVGKNLIPTIGFQFKGLSKLSSFKGLIEDAAAGHKSIFDIFQDKLNNK